MIETVKDLGRQVQKFIRSMSDKQRFLMFYVVFSIFGLFLNLVGIVASVFSYLLGAFLFTLLGIVFLPLGPENGES